MDMAEAESQVRRLAAEWITERDAAASAAQKASGLGKIIAVYVEMYPELRALVEEITINVPTEDGRPRGAEAVRAILQASPKSWFRVSEMVSELNDRGWLPDSDNPANAVRTALERLKDSTDSDVYKGRADPNTVVYTYDPDRPRENRGGYDEMGEDPF